jgi:KDO2-lipid IV(A) lauroyltransferase
VTKHIKATRRLVLAHLVGAVTAVLAWVPRRFAARLGAAGGLLAHPFASQTRRRASAHLALAFGDALSAAERRGICRRMFANLGRAGMEMLTIGRWTREEIESAVDVAGSHPVLRGLLEEGRGAILLTGHFGNWELFGAYAALHYDVHVVAREGRAAKYEAIMRSLREAAGVKVIYQSDSPRDMLRVLRRNAVIAILPDQDIHRLNGAFVEFFGRPAYTPTGPVALALASRAPILPVYLLREGAGHRVVLGPVIRPERGDSKEEAVVEYTQRWSDVFEDIVRRHPDQWIWMHKRWSTTQAKLMRRHGRTAPVSRRLTEKVSGTFFPKKVPDTFSAGGAP